MNDSDSGAILELRGVDKSYRGTKAVSGADLVLRRGEILGLVGENGAGKSTLSGIISGQTRHDGGELLVDGHAQSFRRPVEAQSLGISRIAQEISLVPQLTVAENVFLGSERGRERLRIGRRALERRYADLLADLDLRGTEFDVSARARVEDLSISDQQKVEIIRALARRSRIIILDEPTSALGRQEAEVLLATLARLRGRGLSMIYVSHILEDVLEVCDRVTVMRDGLTVESLVVDGHTPGDLISLMLGREVESIYPPKEPPADVESLAPVLEVQGLARARQYADISLAVRPGEIVGLVGLVGSGRSEILRGIYGADRADAGRVLLAGRPYERRRPRRSIRAGMTMLTESRRDDGLIPELSIKKNITISSLRDYALAGVIRAGQEGAAAQELSSRVDIRQRTLGGGIAAELSGGNQQKMLFARSLIQEPRIMLIDEPTRGVDVGARAGIYRIIAESARNGAGVLLVSSEVEEVLELCHRAYVVRNGSIVTELTGAQMSVERAIAASFGQVTA